MNFHEFAKKIQKTYELLLENKDIPVDPSLAVKKVEFHCDNRSEGTTVIGDQVDSILFDLMDLKKIKIEIS